MQGQSLYDQNVGFNPETQRLIDSAEIQKKGMLNVYMERYKVQIHLVFLIIVVGGFGLLWFYNGVSGLHKSSIIPEETLDGQKVLRSKISLLESKNTIAPVTTFKKKRPSFFSSVVHVDPLAGVKYRPFKNNFGWEALFPGHISRPLGEKEISFCHNFTTYVTNHNLTLQTSHMFRTYHMTRYFRRHFPRHSGFLRYIVDRFRSNLNHHHYYGYPSPFALYHNETTTTTTTTSRIYRYMIYHREVFATLHSLCYKGMVPERLWSLHWDKRKKNLSPLLYAVQEHDTDGIAQGNTGNALNITCNAFVHSNGTVLSRGNFVQAYNITCEGMNVNVPLTVQGIEVVDRLLDIETRLNNSILSPVNETLSETCSVPRVFGPTTICHSLNIQGSELKIDGTVVATIDIALTPLLTPVVNATATNNNYRVGNRALASMTLESDHQLVVVQYGNNATNMTLPGPEFERGTVFAIVNGYQETWGGNLYDQWYTVSDRRQKTNITPLNTADVRARLKCLKPITFNYIGAIARRNAGRHYGFIAQDSEPCVPESVRIDRNGGYSLNQNEYLPMILHQTQELIHENEELRTVLGALKKDMMEMKHLMSVAMNTKNH